MNTDPLDGIETFLEFLDAIGGQHLDRDAVGQLRDMDQSPYGRLFMERLRELVNSVQSTGRKGSITLRLSAKLAGNNKITFEPEIKVSLPKAKGQEATLFTDEDGGVRRSQKGQGRLDFKRLEGRESPRSLDEVPAQEARTVE